MNKMYEVYLKKCLLPVTPDKIQLSINNNNKTITLIDEGQINILKKAELTDIELDCLIPQVRYPFAVYKDGFKDASYYLDYFEKLKISQKPFQFIVSRALPGSITKVDFDNKKKIFKFNEQSLFGNNMKVSLEDYKIMEEAKNGFDLIVKIRLKQFRKYGTKKINIDDNKANVIEDRETNDSPASKLPTTYKVVKGDSLWGIAKKYYGNGSKYMVIFNVNKDKIKNPNNINIGQVLTIPTIK